MDALSSTTRNATTGLLLPTCMGRLKQGGRCCELKDIGQKLLTARADTSVLCQHIHTRTHRCVVTGWTVGLLKASARGGRVIGHRPVTNNKSMFVVIIIVTFIIFVILFIMGHCDTSVTYACTSMMVMNMILRMMVVSDDVTGADERKPILVSAAKSYDPDFPDSDLEFTWYCSSGECYVLYRPTFDDAYVSLSTLCNAKTVRCSVRNKTVNVSDNEKSLHRRYRKGVRKWTIEKMSPQTM